ncbi:MAG TPA: glycogen debranching N-terminal domain-containing protein [Trueperaceae bacterium]
MDFSRNIVLKENYAFLVADQEGQVERGERGLYSRDTRFLDRYRWRVTPELQTLLIDSARPDRFRAHHALLDNHHQQLALRRTVRVSADRLLDTLVVEATGLEPRVVTLELEFDSDFADLFEVRGWGETDRRVKRKHEGSNARLDYRARDGREIATLLSLSEAPEWKDTGRARFVLELQPGETRTLEVEVEMQDGSVEVVPRIDYLEWRERFSALSIPTGRQRVVQRAIDDLRALLLFTEDGPFPAAGIPWFVAAFGRDALLTGAMLLPWASEVAEGTLRYLARHQGKRHDPFRAEAPGKIMHELRFGELARTGRVPHSPYYGTVDATPLFIVLLGRLHETAGRPELVRELRPNWEAALDWMEREGDIDGDGFLEFTPARPGEGLNVQSWKDSEDSMSHSDGTLAQGELAVSEVQGYAFEAYLAAASFYAELGEAEAASRYRERAGELRAAFDGAFWIEEMGTYALALDGEKRPLAVHNSDAGHLLWSGIVPRERAPRLVETLFSAKNWSGWGFRTLGSTERRYNPVSYHNGSVWPHDSALIAAGMANYGFTAEASRVRDALFDLAQTQPDLRLPELVGGYDRSPAHSPGSTSSPPIPYPVACRPQAWDAATTVYLLSLPDD